MNTKGSKLSMNKCSLRNTGNYEINEINSFSLKNILKPWDPGCKCK